MRYYQFFITMAYIVARKVKGNIFFLEEISNAIELYDILKECYPDIYKILRNTRTSYRVQVLLSSFYEIMGKSKNYLYINMVFITILRHFRVIRRKTNLWNGATIGMEKICLK